MYVVYMLTYKGSLDKMTCRHADTERERERGRERGGETERERESEKEGENRFQAVPLRSAGLWVGPGVALAQVLVKVNALSLSSGWQTCSE